MNETEKELEKEIDKWSEKLEEKLKNFEVEREEFKEFKKNIKAYYEDSKHFKEEGDFIRSFEALVWAWAILDTLEKMKDKLDQIKN